MKNRSISMILVFLLFSNYIAAQLNDVTFDYQYDIKIETIESENVEFSFLLDDEKAYLGMIANQAGMDVVVLLNPENKNLFSLIDQNGMKMAIQTPMNSQNNFNHNVDFSNAKVKDLPPKNIAGFKAQGKFVETPNYHYEIYYTDELDYNFYEVFEMNSMKPFYKEVQQQLQIPKQSVMLETKIINAKDNKTQTKMTCVAFKEISKTIKASEYEIQNMSIKN